MTDVSVTEPPDVAAAERSCVLAVTKDGMKLQFAMLKFGLKYGNQSKEKHNLRYQITKAKKELKNKQLRVAERKTKMLQAKAVSIQELKRRAHEELSLRLSAEKIAKRAKENAANYRVAQQAKLDAQKDKTTAIQRSD